MGRPKGTLPFADSTIVGTIVRRLQEGGADQILVVTRAAIAPLLDLPCDSRVKLAFNEDDSSEMIDSFRAGLSILCPSGMESGTTEDHPAPSRPSGILAVPGDTPAIRSSTYRLCFDTFRQNPTRIVIAAYRGNRGHPAIFPVALLEGLGRLTAGLRELVGANADRVLLVETNDPGVLRDVDTPFDYECIRGFGAPPAF